MASLMPQGKHQYLDSSGAPLAGGKLYTYAAGTSTPLATYSDQAGTTPNANPVVLDARGEATIFWTAATGYKVELRDSADALLWTQDTMYAPADPSNTAAFAAVRTADGTVGAPSHSWTSDTDTGLYRIGPGNVGLSIDGTKRWDFAATGSALTGTLTVSGAATLQSTLGVTGAATLQSTLGVTGLATLSGGIAGAVVDDATTELNSNVIRVKDAGITRAKLAVVGQQVSAGSATFTTTSTTYVDVTSLTASLTTTGRPVVAIIGGADASNPAQFSIVRTAGSGNAYLYVRIVRDTTPIGSGTIGINPAIVSTTTYTPGSLVALDAPGAGTYTYKVQARVFGADMTGGVQYANLTVFEL